MDKWEKQHRAELAKIDKRIKAIYEAAAQEAAAIGVTIDGLTDELFRFSRFPLTHKRIDDLLQALHDRLQTAIINGVQSQWTLANNKNNELCRVVFGDNIGKLTKEQYKQYFSNNDAARDAFLARKEAGLGLSDRVWQYTDMFKTELEMGLDVGIRDGLPADEMARELKSYLQYPDKLFRRVRDEHGQLVLSQAAKAFHPGQGVYRSSFMNARRLAVTETNMAYRTADYERWQQLDFVVGIEVHLSGNHTAKGHKGVFIDICDELQGKYPKDFRFVGWHPFCRCYSTSILKTPAEMERDEERIMQGKEPTEGSKEQITDVPDGFKQWLSDNEERISKAQKLPYFIRDNSSYTSKIIGNRTFLTSVPQLKKLDFNSDVDKIIGVDKGTPMTFEQANEHRGNPHYVQGSGDGYTVNCQSCVVAYELRRRGYDVEAMANLKTKGNIPYELSKKTNDAWIDPVTGRTPDKMYAVGRILLDADMKVTTDVRKARYQKGNFSTRILYEQINAATKEKGRYHIDWTWKGKKSGHIISVERLDDGKLMFYDPQTGKVENWAKYRDRISSRNAVGILRVDNLQINTKIIDGVVAKAGTTKPLTRSRFETIAEDCYQIFLRRSQEVGRAQALKDIKASFELFYKKEQFKWNEVLDYFLEKEMSGVTGTASNISYSKKMADMYFKPMSALQKKKVIVNGKGQPMQVKFNRVGNKHIFNDILHGNAAIKFENLADIDTILENAKFIRKAKLRKTRKDGIKRFYYYEAKVDGKTIYLHVAEEDIIGKSKKIRHYRYLYAITNHLL